MIAKHLIPIDTDPVPVEFTDKQLKIFWLPEEVNVEKDIQDVLVNFTPAERHGVITALKLFSLYETHAGDEWWGGRFKQMFDGAEWHRMAATFAMFELAVHGPFYNKINQLLHLDDEKFYLSYLENPVLKERMEHIAEIIGDNDDLAALGVFSMVEGVVLYSTFAYLKHFQSQGKNKLLNVVRGINFSLRDENLHSLASAYAFKVKAKEAKLNAEQWEALKLKIKNAAAKILEHEIEIIGMIFEKGTQDGITAKQMINFVESRINTCLQQMGFSPMYDVKYDPISEWFYKAINDYTFNDFFSGIGREYARNWDESRFVWKTE
jgi:ribonucleoside-diphosphate reductase beta chain